MGTSEEAFHFVDLFAGLGGFHVALEELDGRGVFAAEREPKLKALYKVNFGVDAWGDLNELSSDEIIALNVPDHHVLTAGFPCQPNRPLFAGDPEVRILGYGKEQMWK